MRPTRSQTQLADLQLIKIKKKKNPAAADKSQADRFMTAEVMVDGVTSRHQSSPQSTLTHRRSRTVDTGCLHRHASPSAQLGGQ